MSDEGFRAFLELFMVSDLWPLAPESHTAAEDVLDDESRKRGFMDWIDAYHSF